MVITNHQPEVNNQFEQLNKDIEQFPQVHPVTPDMHITHKGVSRLVMIDRYSFKDTEKKTLKAGDFVVLTVKADPKFPARGLGTIQKLDMSTKTADILIEEDYRSALDDPQEQETGVITRSIDVLEKPLEIFYEQIAKRNATGLAAVEKLQRNAKSGLRSFISN